MGDLKIVCKCNTNKELRTCLKRLKKSDINWWNRPIKNPEKEADSMYAASAIIKEGSVCVVLEKRARKNAFIAYGSSPDAFPKDGYYTNTCANGTFKYYITNVSFLIKLLNYYDKIRKTKSSKKHHGKRKVGL